MDYLWYFCLTFLATNTKVTCLSESVFFSFSYFGVTAIFTAMWVILSERPITRGVQYVMKTAQYIPKFCIYTLNNYFH